ncbi:MAG: fasciclin domain-containing protein [Thermodesulfobacteriota bacterium]
MYNLQKSLTALLFVAVTAVFLSSTVFAGSKEEKKMMKEDMMAESTVMVGGQPMLPSKDIVDNAVNSANHTTLVAAVKAAGLVETLKSEGPFTVFAPTNDAFENLPEGTVKTLLKPENKDKLTKVLTYHVVAGKLDSAAIAAAIKKNGGKVTLKTVSGGTLTATTNGPTNVVLVDENGNHANISTYDVNQSNGVIHVIDTVLLPK